MKIGVLSDTHIPVQAKEMPQKMLEAFKGVDLVIHAGDLVDLSVLAQLRKVCANVRAVRGTMDSYDVRGKLPEKEIIEVGGHKIGVVHGSGAPDGLMEFVTEAFRGKGVDIYVFGHSHRSLNLKKGDILYFNPGSPTDKVFAEHNSYGIIEITDTVKSSLIEV